MSEFYVGYSPKAPPRLGRRMRRTVLALNGLAIVLGLVLVAAQSPFPEATFEYLQFRDYKGSILSFPYPSLLTADGRYFLVAPGKHSAGPLTAHLDGRSVKLRGALFHRDGGRWLEIEGEPQPAAGGPALSLPVTQLGSVTLDGEIVDSKCYFGVMNPGSGKVHRDCAVRCISGGIPPGFLVRDAAGTARFLLLTGAGGRGLRTEVLDYVAEPIRIDGSLVRHGGVLFLQAEPATFRRLWE